MDTLLATDRERLSYLEDEFHRAELEFNHSFKALEEHEQLRLRLVHAQARAAERRNALLKEVWDLRQVLGLTH